MLKEKEYNGVTTVISIHTAIRPVAAACGRDDWLTSRRNLERVSPASGGETL